MKTIKNLIRNHMGLIVLLVGVFGFHSIVALVPPLNGDEATFWEWSRHLALGYYAHPPMTAWLISLMTAVFGVAKYTVRLNAILLHLGTIIFVYKLGWEVLKTRRSGFLAAFLYSILPLSFVMGTAMTTDAALVFFFTAAVYFIRKAVAEQETNYWYWTGIACGGMLLTKFMAALFVPGIFLFLVIHRDYRRVFLTKEPYLAGGLSALIFSPFLYWNYKNDWLTFQFNLYMRHREEGYDPVKPIKYLAGQMLAASPFIFVILLIALCLFIFRFYWSKSESHRKSNLRDSLLLLIYFIAFPLVYFGATSAGVEVAPHWTGIIYPIAMVIVIAWFQQVYEIGKNKGILRSKLFLISVVTSLGISLAMALVVIFPKMLPDRLIYTEKVYDEAPILSHYFGWEEIGEEIDLIRNDWEKRPEGLFFTSKDYSLASMLGFYTPSHPNFYLMNVREDVVHGKSYLLWEKGKKKIGANTIYVGDTPTSYKSRLTDFFKEIKHLDPFVVRDDDGRILRIFYIAIGISYLGGEPDNLSLW
jgi:4-amino-4-deoxy-L-arabinose transferase-like glycosyltransferase